MKAFNIFFKMAELTRQNGYKSAIFQPISAWNYQNFGFPKWRKFSKWRPIFFN
jgi:hypothetical protein